MVVTTDHNGIIQISYLAETLDTAVDVNSSSELNSKKSSVEGFNRYLKIFGHHTPEKSFRFVDSCGKQRILFFPVIGGSVSNE